MTTYVLKRLFQKTFSTEAEKERIKVSGFSNTTLLEIFKLLFLSSSCPGDINHWLNHLTDTMKKSGHPVKTLLGIVDNYKNLPRQFNESFVKGIRNNKTVSLYVESLFNNLKNQKEGGEYKYKDLLPNDLSTSEINDLIKQIKYMALCITEQLNPKYDNWWDRKVETTQVNWDSSNIPTPKLIREIISSILGYDI